MSEKPIEISVNKVKNLETPTQDAEDKVKQSLLEYFEKEYAKLVNRVIDISDDHLKTQNTTKSDLRSFFTNFFVAFLFVQYIALVVLLVLNATLEGFNISDNIFLTYITSVFVETLGVIIIMVTFAYGNKTESSILDVLKTIVGEYKKFDDKK